MIFTYLKGWSLSKVHLHMEQALEMKEAISYRLRLCLFWPKTLFWKMIFPFSVVCMRWKTIFPKVKNRYSEVENHFSFVRNATFSSLFLTSLFLLPSILSLPLLFSIFSISFNGRNQTKEYYFKIIFSLKIVCYGKLFSLKNVFHQNKLSLNRKFVKVMKFLSHDFDSWKSFLTIIICIIQSHLCLDISTFFILYQGCHSSRMVHLARRGFIPPGSCIY